MATEILNNFPKFKDQFKTDTGLEYNKENMSLYIQYFNSRMNDMAYQTTHLLTHQLLNKLNFLPGEIRLAMAEMIREHEVIKQIVASLKK